MRMRLFKTDAVQPWNLGPSIYEALKLWDGTGEFELPDEPPHKPGSIRFGPGVMDGIAGRHFGFRKSARAVKATVAAILRVLSKETPRNQSRAYRMLLRADPLASVDDVLEELDTQAIYRFQFIPFARWLLRQAAHREVLKQAIALVGHYGDPSDMNDLLLVGRHDELTLFSCVAISKIQDDPLDALWALAKSVDGWGRIQVVERLATEVDDRPDIQDWLLREGFCNSIMNEYLAHCCALGGKLHEVVRRGAMEDDLLESVASLMEALFIGGPAEGIFDYPHSKEVILGLQSEFERRSPGVPGALWSIRVRQFLDGDSERACKARAMHGWSISEESALRRRVAEYLSEPRVAAEIGSSLTSDDKMKVGDAWLAAKFLGLDLWHEMFALLQKNPSNNYYLQEALVSAGSPDRTNEVLDWVQANLPLQQVAAGPALDYFSSNELDFCVSTSLEHMRGDVRLRLEFVQIALKSRVISTRNTVLRALARTPRDRWEKTIVPALQQAARQEPDEDVRKRIRAILRNDLSEWQSP